MIYSYSNLHTKSLKDWQNSFDAGFSGSEGNVSAIDSDDGVNEPITVHELTIQYKVIDGWGNAKTPERLFTFIIVNNSLRVLLRNSII